MRISYWSSDVCSSDLSFATGVQTRHLDGDAGDPGPALRSDQGRGSGRGLSPTADVTPMAVRSEEHTSELQSLMRISYAVFCLKKKTKNNKHQYKNTNTKTIARDTPYTINQQTTHIN